MGGTAARIREQTVTIRMHAQGADAAIGVVLRLAREIDPADEAGEEALLEAVEAIGSVGQANPGQVTLALAQAHRVKAGRRGLVPWVGRHLAVTPGAARGMVESAREIGRLPELAGPLASGRVGASTIRALARTARAVKETDRDVAGAVTETLDLAGSEGVSAANRHVRKLEKKNEPVGAQPPPGASRQRGFLRIRECEGGMGRIEGMLEPQHAVVFKAALDQTVSTWLREGRCGGTAAEPEDGDGIEQLQALALIHLTEACSASDAVRRQASSTLPRLYLGHLDESPGIGRPKPAYGLLVTGPAADWGDRHRTYPRCGRPPAWSPPAHDLAPRGRIGPAAAVPVLPALYLCSRTRDRNRCVDGCCGSPSTCSALPCSRMTPSSR